MLAMLATMLTGLVIRWTAGGQTAQTFFSGSLIVASIAVIAGTVLSFIAAIRRGMISLRAVAVCGVVVAVLIPIVVWQLRAHEMLCLVGVAIVSSRSTPSATSR